MKRIRHSISKEQFDMLTTHTLSDPSLKQHNRVKLLTVFSTLYYTGIRLNEISYITVGKLRELIAEGGGVIYTSKTDKERRIYLSTDAAKALKKLIKDEDDTTYLAHAWNKKTTPMHNIALISLVNNYTKKVLGSGYTSHSFRQGIITDMFAAGAATKVVQEFIGHASPSTTLQYDKPTEQRIRNSLVR